MRKKSRKNVLVKIHETANNEKEFKRIKKRLKT